MAEREHDPQTAEPSRKAWFASFWAANNTTVLGGIATLVVFGGGVWLVQSWLDAPAPKAQKVVQEIALVRPPPPPKKEEPPPPPPEIEEEVDLPEPEPAPEPLQSDEAPPPDLLGLDAEGVAGADGFGLIANRGGRGITDGGGGDRFRWYAGVLRQALSAHLAQYDELRTRNYAITVRLWLNRAGEVQRVLLDESTGEPELDLVIEQALANLTELGGQQPAGIPQPVTLRLVSRL
ncbi:MAG: TonB C-terminal domain-containing protein [Pseudomonadota bacterium]